MGQAWLRVISSGAHPLFFQTGKLVFASCCRDVKINKKYDQKKKKRKTKISFHVRNAHLPLNFLLFLCLSSCFFTSLESAGSLHRMNVLVTNSTFERFCDDNVCVIDWRLTLVDGTASHALTIVNIINLAWSSVLLICGVGLLGYRVIYKGHRLWEQQDSGRIRPKPIESMLALLMIFNVLRMVDSIILLTDAAPNVIFRSFLFEIAWQFGFAAFAVYLIGIATTLAQSHQAISTGWLPSSRQVDILSIFLVFSPFVTNNICSIGAGAYAQQGNYYVADILTRLLYAFCKPTLTDGTDKKNCLTDLTISFPFLRVRLLCYSYNCCAIFRNEARQYNGSPYTKVFYFR